MGFRVVDKSSFTFETDLPPSSRNIHPSGVLHAFRSTAPEASSAIIGTNGSGREEHAFAWIDNSLHVDEVIEYLKKNGFEDSDGNATVFIPYSTKRNWLDRYPHAAPTLETRESGEVVVYLNRGPYPNGLGVLGKSSEHLCAEAVSILRGDLGGSSRECADGSASAENRGNGENDDDDDLVGDEENTMKGTKEKKKRSYKSRASYILQDNAFLPDAERDELHIEIYNYFKWLHSKLSALERKAKEEAVEINVSVGAGAPSAEAEIGEAATDENDANKADGSILSKIKKEVFPGVDVSEMQRIVSKLESTFVVIANAGLEEAGGEDAVGAGVREGAPFLEGALSDALSRLVASRVAAGKPRRQSRKRPRSGPPGINRPRLDWDEMFRKLIRYKEEHGDTLVPRNYEDDPLLANWVHRVRKKKSKLQREGIEAETVPPGKRPFAKTLSAERIARLDSIEFAWTVQGPKTAWDDRFRELMEYYEKNRKWPTQATGSLGEWVNKQRMKYKRGDGHFLATNAVKLDDVGFEWTPKRNAVISWDQGFEKLMEFRKKNGHFDVPCPSGPNVDRKGNQYKFYKFVQSLHVMYRSYKIGRQSGLLTDERVVLLIKHGFEFQNKFN